MRWIVTVVLAAGACPAQVSGPGESVPSFGVTVVAPFGFCGRLYEMPASFNLAARLPRFRRLRSIGDLYTTRLNVPPRDFREGFPGVTGRVEWFAIDYAARFWIETPGEYSFSLLSDDGAALYIDERRVVKNDRVHPPRTRKGRIRLEGGIHDMRVSYFQGPRWVVALVLRVKPPGGDWRVFDTGEFRPPPNPSDWKYPNPAHLEAPRDPCTIERRPQ